MLHPTPEDSSMCLFVIFCIHQALRFSCIHVPDSSICLAGSWQCPFIGMCTILHVLNVQTEQVCVKIHISFGTVR